MGLYSTRAVRAKCSSGGAFKTNYKMTVYKYVLSLNEEAKIELPIGAIPLKVDVQHGSLCLWAMVDPNAKKEVRTFEVFGTGHNMPDFKRRFINTFFVQSGMYVFHAFERIRE